MQRENKFHYSWMICIGCALLMFCSSGLSINTFSIYQPYIISTNAFTNAQSSFLITCRNLFIFISMLLVGLYYKKLSLRSGMALAGIMIVSSFVVYGLANNYAIYIIASALMGLGYGFGTMIPVSILIGKWFNEKKNTALGICTAVTGLSTLGFPTIITWLIELVGLRNTFFIEAVFVGFLIFLSWLLIRNNPEDKGLLPYGEKKEIEVIQKDKGLNKTDWFILAPVLLLIGAVMNVSYSHLGVLIKGEGYSEKLAAIAISVSGIALMCGKFIYGKLVDIIGNEKSNYIFGPLFIIGFALCAFIKNSIVILMISMVIYSIGLAYIAVGLSSWANELSSTKHYAKTIQIFQLGYGGGSLIFSTIPGIIADKCNNSYVLAYLMFGVFAIAIFVAIQVVFYRNRKREEM